MIENQIRVWVKEQLSLGEDPEIIRKTLIELDIDENEVMVLIPKNTIRQKETQLTPKEENKKIINELLPKTSLVSKMKKLIPKKTPNPPPYASKPEPAYNQSAIKKAVISNENTKEPNKLIRKTGIPKPQEKKIGPAQLKMLPAPNKKSPFHIIKTKPIISGIIFLLIFYLAILALSNYVETQALGLI